MTRFKRFIFGFTFAATLAVPVQGFALTAPDNLTSGTFTQRDLTWTMGTHTYTINLSGTGDVVFQDNGTTVWTFNDSGQLVAGSAALLDLGSITNGSTALTGFHLPQCGATPTDPTSAAEGFLCWDQTNNILRVNTGAAWVTAGTVIGAIDTLTLANSETFTSDADAEFDFTRNNAGAVTLMCKDNASPVGGCTLTGAGNSPVALGTTGAGGTTAITLNTDGTGDGEVVLPAGSVSLTAEVTGTLPAANGGTGLASYAVGDLLYASAATTLVALPDVGLGSALISGGIGVAPSWGTPSLCTAAGTLNADPADCAAGTYATGIDAAGVPTCVTSVDLADAATALAADPADCGPGTKAISIVANGDLTCSAIASTDIPPGTILATDLQAAPADLGAAHTTVALANSNATCGGGAALCQVNPSIDGALVVRYDNSGAWAPVLTTNATANGVAVVGALTATSFRAPAGAGTVLNAATSGAGAGVGVEVTASDGNTTGAGGAVTINGGNAVGAVLANGGNINLNPGTGIAGGADGYVDIDTDLGAAADPVDNVYAMALDTSTITASGAASLNGGLTVDTTAFTVANTTGAVATSHPATFTTGNALGVDWAAATTLTGATIGVNVNVADIITNGFNLTGLHVTDVGTPNIGSTEYGLHIEGTNWDQAIVTDDAIQIGGTAALNGGINVDAGAFAVADITGAVTTSHPNTFTTGSGLTIDWAAATTQGAGNLAAMTIDVANVTGGGAAAGMRGLTITGLTAGGEFSDRAIYVGSTGWDFSFYGEGVVYAGGGLTVSTGTVSLPNGEIGAAELGTDSVAADEIAAGAVGGSELLDLLCMSPVSRTFNPTEAGATNDYVSVGASDAAGLSLRCNNELDCDQFLSPAALYAHSLRVNTIGVAPGVGNDTWTITIRANGAVGADPVSCTIDESATTCTDAASKLAISADSYVTVEVTSNVEGAPGDPAATAEMNVAFCFGPQ